MELLYFSIEALIVFGLSILAVGTLIGYYFTKKMEFEANKARFVAEAIEEAKKKIAQK